MRKNRVNLMIPYGRQNIEQADLDAVLEVLSSDFLTQGPKVPEFEKCVAAYVGAAHGVAVNSATSALHVACLALGLGSGDILWTVPNTFVASANCALYCGAEVDFVDIDPVSYNMSVGALEEKLKQAERDGRLPKIVVPVHLCGQSCDMAAISALAKKYGFYIIEDASHAIGGTYDGHPVGDCRYSDITVFSFHPVKIVTTAEGGMGLTNSAELAARMALFRSHGITRDPLMMHNNASGPWYYEQIELGFNYRMTDLHAALGISQMSRLDAFVAKRNSLADRYDASLADCAIIMPIQAKNVVSSRHLYVIRVPMNGQGAKHEIVFQRLRDNGIGVNLHYIPVHTHPFYQKLGFNLGAYPEAERYYAEAISLPMYPDLTAEQQDEVVAAVKSAVKL